MCITSLQAALAGVAAAAAAAAANLECGTSHGSHTVSFVADLGRPEGDAVDPIGRQPDLK
eukprot:CAMPEP_0203927334 /NCGR_PEP_ID=MMETSP0359-20131031/66752_1 /ASSEMBLY_ACC=CAM_ASM_000338 /TAXON_ID=268821 /ORGANISM="Scrippsiella Hangoei, Strain SHTV-5" /LENGTH=59 /DNA_ID=CAMNT_0050856073 /DNA_START=339 /DNA_END=516 /DNA_ORIENTATION=+